MKLRSTLVLAGALVVLAACPLFATPAHSKPAKTQTYTCIHCGNKFMTNAAGLKKICTVCKCGLPAAKCVKH